MKSSNFIVVAVAVVATVIAAVLGYMLYKTNSASNFGNSTQSYWNAAEGFRVDNTTVIDGDGDLVIGGSSGTSIDRINTGTCYIHAAATTIAATSTVTVDCQASTSGTPSALTGVTAGDTVFAQFATTTSVVSEGLTILGASASSTSGYITLKVFNGTGTTFTWSAAASTTNYLALDNN